MLLQLMYHMLESFDFACLSLYFIFLPTVISTHCACKQHRWLGTPIRALGRLAYFSAGFHRIRIKGEPGNAAIFVCAPHSSFFDVGVMFACRGLPAGVSKAENGAIPVLGSTYHASRTFPLIWA